jgi:hypothetical protein
MPLDTLSVDCVSVTDGSGGDVTEAIATVVQSFLLSGLWVKRGSEMKVGVYASTPGTLKNTSAATKQASTNGLVNRPLRKTNHEVWMKEFNINIYFGESHGEPGLIMLCLLVSIR